MDEIRGLMNIKIVERSRAILELRTKVLQAEQKRIEGTATISVAEARTRLRNRIADRKE